MTAALAPSRTTAPARRRAPAAAPRLGAGNRPRLQVLDQEAVRRRARRRNAALLAFVVVLNGLFVVAFVHARLVEGQQDLDVLRSQIADLQAERAQVERAVDEASSPARIVERAEALGMVRAAEPVYLPPTRDIDDG